MLSSLFRGQQLRKREPNLIDQLNNETFKTHILLDFISNFIDNNDVNNAKITKIIKILEENEVFFGGKYIYDIFTDQTNPTIELYISFEYIVDFLIKISDCNKTNDGNILLQELTVSLNINSRYNINKANSVYEINYINNNTNRNITIYVVNDDDIINKILTTDINDHKIFYDFKENIIKSSEVFESLYPSHNLDEKVYDYKDIIIKIIEYIPAYISLDDLSSNFNLIKKLHFNVIYNYPAIWFYFLIALEDYYTYERLLLEYEKTVMTKTQPNSIINLNNIITQIYINIFLNNYKINFQLDSDDTIQFIIDEYAKTELNDEKKQEIKKMLLFYYTYKIFIYPYKYKFQKFIIKNNLVQFISSLESKNKSQLLTMNETIDKFADDCIFFDMITFNDDITKNDVKTFLNDKENILIFSPDNKKGTLISKKNLDKLVLESYKQNWLINCNKLISEKILYSVYVKLTILTGYYYISYIDIYTLFNDNIQIYYIIDSGIELNKTYNFEYYKNDMTTEETFSILRSSCINKNPPIKIFTLQKLSTKRNISPKIEDKYFSSIKKTTSISTMFNKKLKLDFSDHKSKKSRIAHK